MFFDNLAVTHTNGLVLEVTDYYPFGLTMAGISSKAAGKLENKKDKFQGQELVDDLGLNWYGFKWRNHDPQIGRFIEIDPLANKYEYNSTYAFSENKVTTHVELEGLEAEYIFSQAKKEIASTYQAAANWIDRTFSFGSKTKVETPIRKGGKASVVVENTSETKTNLGEGMSFLIQNNSLDGYKGSIFKTDNTLEVSLENKVEVKTPVATVSQTSSVDANGKVTLTADGKVKTTNGLDVSATASKSSDGTTKVGTGLSLGTVNTTFKTGATGSTNGKSSSVQINMGVEIKKDEKKVTNTVFIKAGN